MAERAEAVVAAIIGYKEAMDHYLPAHHRLNDIQTAIKGGETLSQEERADIIFCLKHMASYYDELKKAANHIKEVLDNIIGTVHVATVDRQPSIKGELATVTPKLKLSPVIPSPKKDPTGYKKMMLGLGLDPEKNPAVHETLTRGILRPDWPALKEYVEELAAEGYAFPDGVDVKKGAAKYSTTCRKNAKCDLDKVMEEVCTEENAIDVSENNEF